MSPRLELGILDFCNVYGRPPDDVLWETLEMAPLVEGLGYNRYWLSEHHGSGVAHSTPETMLTMLGAVTDSLRIGSAGVLVYLYQPFKVATDFRFLNTVFPGRIDLGMASGRVSHAVLAQAGLVAEAPVPFETNARDLLDFLRGRGETAVNPLGTAPPEPWLLGGVRAMRLAAALGTGWAFATFLADPRASMREAIDEYRATFTPSPEVPEPTWAVAFSGVCADSEVEARRAAAETADQTDMEATVVGSPDRFRDALEGLYERYGTHRFVFADLRRGFAGRAEGYRGLAERLELTPPATNPEGP